MDIVAKLEENEQRRTTVSEKVVQPPSPRSNFSFVAHPDKEELILFGGEFYNGQTLSVFNELFFYSIAKNEWKLVMAPGGPGPRSSHQMVSVAADGGQLWVHLNFHQHIHRRNAKKPRFFLRFFIETLGSSSAVSIQHPHKCNSTTIETCGCIASLHVNGRRSQHRMDQVHAVVIAWSL